MSGTQTNNFSVGRDVTIIITHVLAGVGGRFDIQHVTGFNPEPHYTSPTVKRLDGIKLTRDLPDGWTAEIDVDRANQSLDEFCDAIENAYYNGIVAPYGSLTYYIQELDGSVSTYQLENASFKIGGLGSWKDDGKVTQKLSVSASRRRKV